MTNRKLTKVQVIEAVANSSNIREILIKLDMAPSGGNYKTIHRWLQKLNLDVSHFTKRQSNAKLSEEQLFSEFSNYSRSRLKDRIIKENIIPYVCAKCGISEWQGEKLSLHLDHINGIRNDNRLENLRFLCPNCHSLTDTYCGKSNKLPNTECVLCGKEITRKRRYCNECLIHTKETKIAWPSIQELLSMISSSSYEQTARALGVSSNAIRKHIKNHS